MTDARAEAEKRIAESERIVAECATAEGGPVDGVTPCERCAERLKDAAAFRALLAQLAESEQEKQKAIASAMTSERFRREDAASHCDDQVLAAGHLKRLKSELAEAQAEIARLRADAAVSGDA